MNTFITPEGRKNIITFSCMFKKNKNNSMFGKTMENVRRRKKVKLVCDKLKAKKLIAKPQLEQFRVVNEDTVLIDRIGLTSWA